MVIQKSQITTAVNLATIAHGSDVVPIVRRDTLAKFPPLRDALADLANKITAEDMRHLNAEVDANQRDPATVVRAFRASKSL